MELIVRLLGSQRAIFTASCIVAALTGIAIIAFDAPPITLVFVTWGGSILLAAMNASRSSRRRKMAPEN
jgi:hypothetical protein